MPSCSKCREWFAPSSGVTTCPRCGLALPPPETLRSDGPIAPPVHRPGHLDSWLAGSVVGGMSPSFRRCKLSDNEFETAPIVFGRGFPFDRVRQVVSVRWRLLWFTVAEETIPFRDARIVFRSKTIAGQYGASRTEFTALDLRTPYGSFLKVTEEPSGTMRRVVSALERFEIQRWRW